MSKIDQGIEILQHFGMPRAQLNERSSLTLLAVLDVSTTTAWSAAKKRIIRIHDIMTFIKKKYNRTYAENSRETIRRQTLHQFEQAGIVVRNPDDPMRPTNSPNNVYQITDEALMAIRRFGASGWEKAAKDFSAAKGRLVDRYEKRKKTNALKVKVDGGKTLNLTPGKHNQLQIAIIEEFKPRFCPDTIVIYVGDTARKLLHWDKDTLEKNNVPITEHDKLPDVVLYSVNKNYLVLIEAVTAHGPVSPKRHVELEKVLHKCRSRRIYVSAFPDFREFKKHLDNIAWETEVWIADNPDHMVHLNGPKFMTVHNT